MHIHDILTEPSPPTEVRELVVLSGGAAELPCAVSRADSVQLVLWMRDGSNTPVLR